MPNSLLHSLTQPLTHPHILTQSLAQPLIHPHIHSLTVFRALFEDDGGRIGTQGGLQTTDLDETFQTHQVHQNRPNIKEMAALQSLGDGAAPAWFLRT